MLCPGLIIQPPATLQQGETLLKTIGMASPETLTKYFYQELTKK